MRTVGWYYNHPQLFSRLSIVIAIWPFILLYFFPQFLPTISLILILLIIFRHWDLIPRLIEQFSQSSVVIRYRIVLFGISGALTLWIMIELIQIQVTPVLLTVLFVIFYYSWSSRQLTKQFDNPYIFIPKDLTTTSSNPFNYSQLLVGLLLTTLTSISIILISSFVNSQGMVWIVSSELHYLLAIPIVLPHLGVQQLFDNYHTWTSDNGISELNLTNIAADQPPPITDHLALTEYVYQLSISSSFNREFFVFIEDNIDELGVNVRKIEYSGFLYYLTHLYLTWGKKTREYHHLLQLLVTSSLKEYQIMARIPVARRIGIYYYLSYIYLAGLADDDWMRIINHEIKTEEDSHNIISWISKGSEIEVEPSWLIVWEGVVYKGQNGLISLKATTSPIYKKVDENIPWVASINTMSQQFLRIFIGPEGRKTLSSVKFNTEIIDQLLQGTIVDINSTELKQKSTSFRRIVQTSVSEKTDTKVGKEQLKRYLDGENLSKSPRSSIKDEIAYTIETIKMKMKSFDTTQLKTISLILLVSILNILALYTVKLMFGPSVLSIILVIEIVGGQIMAVSTDETPDMSKQAAIQDEIAKTKHFTKHSLSKQHQLDLVSTYSLVYFLFLTFFATSFLL